MRSTRSVSPGVSVIAMGEILREEILPVKWVEQLSFGNLRHGWTETETATEPGLRLPGNGPSWRCGPLNCAKAGEAMGERR